MLINIESCKNHNNENILLFSERKSESEIQQSPPKLNPECPDPSKTKQLAKFQRTSGSPCYSGASISPSNHSPFNQSTAIKCEHEVDLEPNEGRNPNDLEAEKFIRTDLKFSVNAILSAGPNATKNLKSDFSFNPDFANINQISCTYSFKKMFSSRNIFFSFEVNFSHF